MPETKGSGGHLGNRQSKFGLFPKNAGQQGQKQGETLSTPGRGPSRGGGKASEQGGRSLVTGSMNKVGGCFAAKDYLVMQADFFHI